MMIYFGCLSIAWSQDFADLEAKLRRESGYPEVARLFNDSSATERQALLANLVKLVQDELLKLPSPSGSRLISNASAAFIAIGDEQALIAAFRDGLTGRYFSDQIDVAEALATCLSDDAVALIEQLARSRLGKLGETLVRSPDEDERRARNDLLGSFVELLKKLAKSANPSGIARAKKIRDEFAALYASDNGKLVLSAIDAELAKVTPHKSSTVNAPSTSTTSLPSVTPPQTPRAPEVKPAAATPSEEPTPSTSWGIIVVLIVAALGLLWLLLKRRSWA